MNSFTPLQAVFSFVVVGIVIVATQLMSMNANQPTELKRPLGADRPFPRRCPRCAKKEVALTQISYDAEIRHDGRLYKFAVPNLEIPICRACGEKVFSVQVDDQLNAALRLHLRLLAPGLVFRKPAARQRFSSASGFRSTIPNPC